MTHTEGKQLFLEKLDEAKRKIESLPEADECEVVTGVSYMDDDFEETDEYDGKSDTSMLGTVEVFIKGNRGEDAPSFALSFIAELSGGKIKSPAAIEKEFKKFDDGIDEFTDGLRSSSCASEFITAESERITREGEEAVRELEEKLEKLSKYVKIALGAFVGLAIIVLVIKLLF